MTLRQITDAVDNGLPVHWSNPGYVVKKGSAYSGYVITFTGNNYTVGLTDNKGILQGDEEDFFIGQIDSDKKTDMTVLLMRHIVSDIEKYKDTNVLGSILNQLSTLQISDALAEIK